MCTGFCLCWMNYKIFINIYQFLAWLRNYSFIVDFLSTDPISHFYLLCIL
uniref:Uncharacterized protein n=1 Tax=Anguilla anguilla TaxID=7936 RepID=A0A0E9SBU1_ANGAN